MKEYKRLTMEGSVFDNIINCVVCPNKTEKYTCRKDKINCLKAVINRLAELENQIENGTLIELPCKVGDKLYSIPFDNSKIFEHKVKGFRIIAISENEKSNYIETDIGFLFGENAFLTKSEAEQRLKELKGEV